MDWSALQEAIRTAVATATGLTDQTRNSATHKRVEWQNKNTGARWADSPCADLTLRSVRGSGTDEIRYEYDEGTDTNVPILVGNRYFTVSVRIESENQDPGSDASHYASLLRTRLRRPATLAALQTAGVALVGVEPAIVRDYRSDGRWVSLAIVDLTLGAAENDTDTTDDGDHIHTIQVEGEAAPGDTAPVEIPEFTVPEP